MNHFAVWIVRLMSVECIIASGAYFWAGNWKAGLYWLSATVINTVASTL